MVDASASAGSQSRCVVVMIFCAPDGSAASSAARRLRSSSPKMSSSRSTGAVSNLCSSNCAAPSFSASTSVRCWPSLAKLDDCPFSRNRTSSRCGPTLVCRNRASSRLASARTAGKSSPPPGTYSRRSSSRAPLIPRCALSASGCNSSINFARAAATRCPALNRGSSKAAISRHRGDEDFNNKFRDRSARS